MTLVIEIPQARSFDLKFHEELSSEEFWEFCSRNPELVVEREADGKISVMTPVSFLTGNKENRLNAYLTIWAIDNGAGETGSSSTGYTLPNGAVKSPDASWVSDERMEGSTLIELARFPPLVPDFVASNSPYGISLFDFDFVQDSDSSIDKVKGMATNCFKQSLHSLPESYFRSNCLLDLFKHD